MSVTTISAVQGSIGVKTNKSANLGMFDFDTNISDYVAGQTYTFTVSSSSRPAFDLAGVQVGDYITIGGLEENIFCIITAINGYTLTVLCCKTTTDSTPAQWASEFIIRPALLAYAITTDGVMSTITEKINGVVVNTYVALSNSEPFIVGLTQAQWNAIKFGKYKDATGGLNTLTTEMDTEVFTYTFDKRFATDADNEDILKSLQDEDDTVIPAIKAQLASAIRGKGGTVNDTDSFETIMDAVDGIPLGKKTASGTTTVSSSTETVYYVSGSTVSKRTVVVPYSAIGFIPSTIILRVVQATVEYRTIYEANENDSLYPNACKDTSYNNGQQTVSTFNIKADVAPLYVNENGFKLTTNTPGGVVMEWIAFE